MLNKIKYTTLGFILGVILFMGLGFIYANSNTEEILAHSDNIKITVNGERISFPDAQPFIDENGRTQVPVRFVSEALGADVGWDGSTKTVTVEQARNKISLVVGKSEYTVNSKKMEMDTSVIIVEDRTFVPIRFVSEALGADVGWDNSTRTVIIKEESMIIMNPNFTPSENNMQNIPQDNPKQTVDGLPIYYFNENGEYDNNGIGYVSLGSIFQKYKNLQIKPNLQGGEDLYTKNGILIIENLPQKLLDSDYRLTYDYYKSTLYPKLQN